MPLIARQAPAKALAPVIDLNERLFALTAVVGHLARPLLYVLELKPWKGGNQMSQQYVLVEQTSKWIKVLRLIGLVAFVIGGLGFLTAWKQDDLGGELDRISLAVAAGGLTLAVYSGILRYWFHA